MFQIHKRRLVETLEAVGEVRWVDNEDLIDIVTALSGGGPAYVFLLTECMAQAGIDAGLPPDCRINSLGSLYLVRVS